jgi:hypothetical protein
MIKNLVIVALVTTNLVFMWAFLNLPDASPTPAPSPAPTVSASAPLPTALTAQPAEDVSGNALLLSKLEGLSGDNYSDDIDKLRAAGVDESILRQLMLATINRDHLLVLANQPESPYWLPDQENAEDRLNNALSWEQERRDQLIGLFGADIIDDPLFVEIFKPLNDTLGFLSSDKQIQLDELRRRDDAQTQALFRGGFTQESRTDLAEQRSNTQRQITELLGVDDGFEYQLRESRLAQRMRRELGSFDYSEAEFRDIFAIRQQNEGNEQATRFLNRGEFRTQREQSEDEIRDYLGNSRYQEYARSQDPAYRSLQSIGERYGNTTAEINDVYAIAQGTQEQINDLREGNTLSREVRTERINEVRQEAIERITQIAGEETANSVRENSRRLGFGGNFSTTTP